MAATSAGCYRPVPTKGVLEVDIVQRLHGWLLLNPAALYSRGLLAMPAANISVGTCAQRRDFRYRMVILQECALLKLAQLARRSPGLSTPSIKLLLLCAFICLPTARLDSFMPPEHVKPHRQAFANVWDAFSPIPCITAGNLCSGPRGCALIRWCAVVRWRGGLDSAVPISRCFVRPPKCGPWHKFWDEVWVLNIYCRDFCAVPGQCCTAVSP